MMGRYYHLSKSVSGESAEEILREIRELEDVRAANLTSDQKYLVVETGDQAYIDVMSAAVNICKRAGNGCELSFAGFSYGSDSDETGALWG